MGHATTMIARREERGELLSPEGSVLGRLLSLTGDRGTVSYEDVDRQLDGHRDDPAFVEALLAHLAREGIELVDVRSTLIRAPLPGEPTRPVSAPKPSVDKDPLSAYLGTLRNIPLLTREGEVELCWQVEDGERRAREATEALERLESSRRSDDERRAEAKKQKRALRAARAKADRARRQIVEANLRLVVSVAKRYANRGVSLLDLIQEGNIGLMKAVEKFEYRRGFKFSTYATWWIRQSVARAVADQARTIRIPIHVNELIGKVGKTSRMLAQRMGREPTVEEIADSLDLPPDRVRLALRTAYEPLRLDAPVGDEDGSPLLDLIEDEGVVDAQDAAVRNDLNQRVRDTLKTLTPREEQILRLRFGIGRRGTQTLEEVGKGFSVTRERIRQIEAKALKRLRQPSESNPLAVLFEGDSKEGGVG